MADLDVVGFMLRARADALRQNQTPRRWQINQAAETALVAHDMASRIDHWQPPLDGKEFAGIPIQVGRARDGNDTHVLIELIVDG